MSLGIFAILATTIAGFVLILGRLRKLELRLVELKSAVDTSRNTRQLQVTLNDLRNLRRCMRVIYHEMHNELPLDLQSDFVGEQEKMHRRWSLRKKDIESSQNLRRSIDELEVSLSTISGILDAETEEITSSLILRAEEVDRQIRSWLEVSGDSASEATRVLGMNYQITEEHYPYHDKEKLFQDLEPLYAKAEYRLGTRIGGFA